MGICRRISFVSWIAMAILGWAQIGSAAQPVTITMIQFDREQEAKWQQTVIDQFHKDQDRIKVELVSPAGASNSVTKAFTMAMAGQPVHIAYADPNDTIGWGLQGLTIDLEPFYRRDAANKPFRDFFGGMLDMHVVKGKRYAVPEDMQVQGFFYNQEHFDEAGLVYPGANWTWDVVAKNAPKLTKDANGDGVPERWAMRDPQYLHWWSVFWAYGAEFVDDPKFPTKFTGDSEQAQKAFEWFHHMIRDLKVMPGINGLKGVTAPQLVGDQSISMAIGNSLYMQEAVALGNKVRWDVAPMPKGPAGNPVGTNSIGWVIFNNVPNQQEAWEVIKYFSSEYAMRLAVDMRGTLVPHVPTAKSMWLKRYDYPKSKMVFVENVDHAQPWPIIYGPGLNSIRNNFANYLADKISLPQALEGMRKDVTTWIGTLKR